MRYTRFCRQRNNSYRVMNMKSKMQMMPKTFIMESEKFIYAYIPKSPFVSKAGIRMASCVFVCPQFMDYNVDKYGRRIIAQGVMCPYATAIKGRPVPCDGSRVCLNGEIVCEFYGYNPVKQISIPEYERQMIIADLAKRNQNGR